MNSINGKGGEGMVLFVQDPVFATPTPVLLGNTLHAQCRMAPPCAFVPALVVTFTPRPPIGRELVAARRARVPWKVLMSRYGKSRTTLWRLWRAELDRRASTGARGGGVKQISGA